MVVLPFVIVASFAAVLRFASAYRSLTALIPNAENVPNPCNRLRTVAALGHYNLNGGDALNPFGLAMEQNGYSWETICPLDSDGDGMTNGQELGDPYCRWRPGTQPDVTARNGLSHPGICEPLDAPSCKRVNMLLDRVQCQYAGLAPPPRQVVVYVQPRSIFPDDFAFCPQNDEPYTRPTSWSNSYQCDSDNPCPSAYGCVAGPLETMAICCPIRRPQPCPAICPPITTPSCRVVCQPVAATTPRPTQPPCQVVCQPRPTPCQPACQPAPTTLAPTTPSRLVEVILGPRPGYMVVNQASRLVQSPVEWCFRDPETGPCRNLVVGWYYDTDNKRCMPFAYGGCVQLPNGLTAQRGTFESRSICESTCITLFNQVGFPVVRSP